MESRLEDTFHHGFEEKTKLQTLATFGRMLLLKQLELNFLISLLPLNTSHLGWKYEVASIDRFSFPL